MGNSKLLELILGTGASLTLICIFLISTTAILSACSPVEDADGVHNAIPKSKSYTVQDIQTKNSYGETAYIKILVNNEETKSVYDLVPYTKDMLKDLNSNVIGIGKFNITYDFKLPKNYEKISPQYTGVTLVIDSSNNDYLQDYEEINFEDTMSYFESVNITTGIPDSVKKKPTEISLVDLTNELDKNKNPLKITNVYYEPKLKSFNLDLFVPPNVAEDKKAFKKVKLNELKSINNVYKKYKIKEANIRFVTLDDKKSEKDVEIVNYKFTPTSSKSLDKK